MGILKMNSVITHSCTVSFVLIWYSVSSDVTWELSNDRVIIGNSVILTCTVDGIEQIDENITRQWSIGDDGQLISFNGRRNRPLKYEEILTGNQFSLKINNVTETDLQSIYECRYGFDVHNKQLKVDESLIMYPEAKDSTDVSYNLNDSTVDVKITLMKGLPFQNCAIKYKNENVFEFQVLANSKHKGFPEASVTLPCKDENSFCNKEYSIVCSFNSIQHHDDKPVVMFKENSKTVIITSTTLVCCLIMLILVTCTIIYNCVNRYGYENVMSIKGNPKEEQTFSV